MGARQRDFQARLAVQGPGTPPQPDPNASLGGVVSSTDLEGAAQANWTTVTSATVLISTTLIGQGIAVGSYVVMNDRTGNENVERRIIAFNDGTGEVTLEEAFPVLPQVGDNFRIFQANQLFAAYTPSASRSRLDRYRLIYYGNPGAQIIPAFLWVEPIDPGPLRLELATGTITSGFGADIPFIPNENTRPDIETSSSGLFQAGLNIPQEFADPQLQALRIVPRIGGSSNQINSSYRPVWIRLSFVNDEVPRNHRAVFRIWGEADLNGPEVGSFLVIVDIAEPELTYELGADRRQRISGGARVRASVTDAETAQVASNRTAVIELVPPSPGTLGAQNTEETTPDGEIPERVYISPTDGGQEGANVQFRVRVW